MIKVLIADDSPAKLSNVINSLKEIPLISDNDITTASDIFTTRTCLRNSQFDILILDLLIPDRHGYPASIENSLFLLKELKSSEHLYKPVHVIGLTEFDDAKAKLANEFESFLFNIIKYEEHSNTWKDYLKNFLTYFINMRSNASTSQNNDYDFDIAIVTALRDPELKAILKLDANWSDWTQANDSTIYHVGKFASDSKSLKVVAATQNQMGLTSAATLSCKLINTFRPRYLANIGIAAGISGVGNFGDILICDMAWEYSSGKIISDTGGNPYNWPDPKSIQLDPFLKERLSLMTTHADLLATIKHNTDAHKPNTELKALIGPLASGASVIQCKSYIDSILQHNRKLIGIDMETFAIFYAAHNTPLPHPIPFSLKSICDFADEHKGDNYQSYAAHTSSVFFYKFCLNYL